MIMFWKKKYSFDEIEAMRECLYEIANHKYWCNNGWFSLKHDRDHYENRLRTYLSQGITLQELQKIEKLWKDRVEEKHEKERDNH